MATKEKMKRAERYISELEQDGVGEELRFGHLGDLG